MTSFTRAVWAALTWRKLLAMEALGLALSVAHVLMNGAPLQSVLLCTVAAAPVTLIILGADEALNRGGNPIRVYPAAIVIVLTIVTAVYWAIHGVFASGTGLGWDAHWESSVAPILDDSVLCILALAVYLNRRSAQRTLEAVRASELQRVQIATRLVAMRLAMTEAQVDPQQLFDSLADIRNRLADAPEAADERLDELIRGLRSALDRTLGDAELESITT